jgi:hypothetical protein
MQQRRDGRTKPRAVAGHRDRLVRHAYLEADPAVVALMHIARHVTQKRREIDLLPRDCEFVCFQLTKFTQLRDDRTDSLAGSFGLLQHFFLLVS